MNALDSSTTDWNTFESDMRDYAPLWPNCDDIEDQIGKFSGTSYMRDNMAPLLAVSTGFFPTPARKKQGNTSAPTTRLTVRGKGFAVPGDIEALAAHLGNSRVSRHTVCGQDVEILDDYAGPMWISNTHSDILTKLKVIHDGPAGGILTTKTNLAALDVFGDGSHQLTTTANNRHLVTIFIILPFLTTTGRLRTHITYETASEHQDISVRGGAIGLYAGVSESGARLDVARAGQVICLTYHTFVVCSYGHFRVPKFQYLFGGLTPLPDAFCAWNHQLKTPALMLWLLHGSPKSAEDLEGVDATLVCHLAPLAKAYGFKIHIGSLVYTLSTERGIRHGWTGMGEFEIDASKLRMPPDAEKDYEWQSLYTLEGTDVTTEWAQDDLILACDVVASSDELQDVMMHVVPEARVDINQGLHYYSDVTFSHDRWAYFLFVTPRF
ncbi:hypothetical protein DFH08DRAFT_971837 [Mycena albidolilacea]|uniref:Uncharacterized protein n=1 Tax=Mycena albidolilacea TaxID=1033008 RepID=A0AAD7EF13_9AGAR|nr:hypothetical protein DFH08DRAFT_971837 [Mycena albidolilacea]